jgi:hypothetical protein
MQGEQGEATCEGLVMLQIKMFSVKSLAYIPAPTWTT